MAEIISITAREILDSRGDPTVEADLVLSDGSSGQAAVPSGASTGSHEAVELRDGDRGHYGGKGVLKAAANANGAIAGALKGREWDQVSLDGRMSELDGTPDKSRLGANAILAVSLAFASAAAASRKEPLRAYFASLMPGGAGRPFSLPVPMMNIVNGGRHASGGPDIQEYMIVPIGFPSFKDSLRAGAETYHALKSILRDRGLSTLVGDEGGFAPSMPSDEAPLPLLVEAVEKAGYKPGEEIALALDAAASEFRSGDGSYRLNKDGKTMTSGQMIGWYESLAAKYPVISIEDGLAEDDWEGWKAMTASLAGLMLVGDDLFATNKDRLADGVAGKAANAMLIKPNQAGTVTESIEAAAAARAAGYKIIVSHRSGETEHAYIADLAVGIGAGFIKAGAPCRSERTAKYNRLLRLEEEIASE